MARLHPHLSVVEADLVGMDGPELIRRMAEVASETRVIVLAEPQYPQHVHRSLEAGAFAIIVKSASADGIAVAARQAVRSSIFFSAPAPTPVGGVESRRLTPRELEVVRLAGEGRSNGEIARTLRVTEQTVKFHLSNVYRRHGLANRTLGSSVGRPARPARMKRAVCLPSGRDDAGLREARR
ncbi:MAG: response regulator transcription factor [Actinomycetota bacterium]|nr:response regulator transcription factor [Actinomycetota bacterium]